LGLNIFSTSFFFRFGKQFAWYYFSYTGEDNYDDKEVTDEILTMLYAVSDQRKFE